MKELYWRYIAEVWDQRRTERLEQFFTPDHLDHDAPPGQGLGIDHLRAVMAYMQSAFPDCSVRIEELYVDGPTLIARITFSGTHRGESFGLAPTGRRVEIGQIHILRFRDGKMAEHWSKSDDLLMLRQPGAVPPQPAPAAGPS
jgi:predicted ester cyclase